MVCKKTVFPFEFFFCNKDMLTNSDSSTTIKAKRLICKF